MRQIVDAAGTVQFAQSYEPYGDVLTSVEIGDSANYGYANEWTSQGLIYLRARYYAPSIGRFLTRDTWGGNNNRPQSLNRWAYVEGNPVNYSDPSGNCVPGESCHGYNQSNYLNIILSGYPSLTSAVLNNYLKYMSCNQLRFPNQEPWMDANYYRGSEYNVKFEDSKYRKTPKKWTQTERFMVFQAIWDVSNKLSKILLLPPPVAFKLTYGVPEITPFIFDFDCPQCTNDSGDQVGMYTNSSRNISVGTFSPGYLNGVHNVVHELGHAFENRLWYSPKNGDTFRIGRTWLARVQEMDQLFPDRPNNPGVEERDPLYGFAGHRYNWQQSASGSAAEEFADMFLGWTYNTWEGDFDGLRAPEGQMRAEFMDLVMPFLVVWAATK